MIFHSTKARHIRATPIIMAAAASLTLGSYKSLADTYVWTNTNGNWQNGYWHQVVANVNGGTPTSGSEVFITHVDSNVTLASPVDYSQQNPIDNIQVGGPPDNTGYYGPIFPILNQTSGYLKANSEDIGPFDNDNGSYNISGGTDEVESEISLGYQNNAYGYTSLTGTSTLISPTEYIGYSGSGAFSQNGASTLNSAGTIFIAAGPSAGVLGSSSNYTMDSGTLQANSVQIYGFPNPGSNIQSGINISSFNMQGGTVSIASSLQVGSYTQRSATVNANVYMTGGTLTTPLEQVVGAGNGFAEFDQAGGTNNTNDLTIGGTYGAGNGDTATYELLSSATATLNVSGPEYIGYTSNGIGNFVHSSGLNHANMIYIGFDPGTTGDYYQSGGTVSATFEVLGDDGTGTYTQTGGTNTTTYFTLGTNQGSSGNYDLSIDDSSGSTGTLNVSTNEVIGGQGRGSFNQVDGTNSVQGLYLGYGGSAIGTYVMSGGTLTSTGGETIGVQGEGYFTQSGGTNTVGSLSSNQNLVVASSSPYNSYYYISDTAGPSALNVYGNIYVGYDSGSVGYLFQSGGAINVTSNVFDDVFIGYNGIGSYQLSGDGSLEINGPLEVAAGAGSMGDIQMNGGTIQDGWEYVGVSGTGTFTQTAGAHTAYSFLSLGDGASGVGTYNLQGGTLNVGGGGGVNGLFVGNAGTGTFNQIAGTVTSSVILYVGDVSGSTGNYNLSGTGSL